MALAFPATPTVGQVYGPGNGYLYVYDGNRWVGQTSSNFGDSTITQSGAINITDPLPSTSPTTGALTVAGGVGINGDLHVAGVIHASNNTSTVELFSDFVLTKYIVAFGAPTLNMLVGDNTFNFSSMGLTFPDGSVQGTAFTSTASGSASALVNGAFTATLDGTYGIFSIPGVLTNNNPSSGGIAISPSYAGQSAAISNNSGFQEFFVQDDGAYVQTSANNSGTTFNTWVFGTNGQLQLPVTGVIGDTYGDGRGASIAAGPASNSYAGINNYTGDQWFEADNNAVYIGTNFLTDGGYQWTFDKSGGITFPDHTVQTTAYTGGGGGGSGISSTFTGTFTTKNLVINNDLVINKTGGSNFISGNDLTFTAPGQINMFGDLYLANRAEFSDGTIQSTAYTGTVAWSNITNGPTPEAFKPTTFNPVKIITNGPTYPWYSLYGDNLNVNKNVGAGSVYDSQGNLFVVGTVVNGSDSSGIILKYSSTGQLLFHVLYDDTSALGTTSTLFFEAVSIDNADNLYVLVNSTIGGTAASVLRFNTSESLTLDTRIPVSQSTTAEELAVDSAGNIYVTGVDNNSTNMFLIKFNSSGVIQWTKELTLSGSSDIGIAGICVDSTFVYVAMSLLENGTDYAVTSKFAQSNGALSWSQQLPGIGIDVAVDGSGNVYTTYIGGGIIKYNSGGTALWKVTLPSIPTLPSTIVVGGDGYIYVSGQTALDFSTLEGNLFWMKLDSSGNVIGQYQFGNANVGTWPNNGHRASAVNTSGNVISIAGYKGTPSTASILTIQLPIDGSLATGTMGEFAYIVGSLSTSLVTSSIGSSASGIAEVAETWVATTLPVSVYSNTATYTSTTFNGLSTTNNSTWTFGISGLLTLPNGTILGANPPTHSYGKPGDLAGMVAYTTSTMYYCTSNYVNNSTNIWAKVALTLSTF